jgi:2-polyprenyl-3-methyl-5-hydroxy-6-metoxy-1,4-benzoquinol methylase
MVSDSLKFVQYFPGKVVDYYDAVAQVYGEKDFFTDQDNIAIQQYIHLLRKRGVDEIYDFGCGTGKVSEAFAKEGFQVVGIDMSEQMLNVARNQHSHPSIKYLHADFEEFISNSTFSDPLGVIFLYSLIHMGNLRCLCLLAQLAKMLPRDSLLMLAMHYDADAVMTSPLSDASISLSRWTREQFTSDLKQIGFQIVYEHIRSPQAWEINNTKAFLILQPCSFDMDLDLAMTSD